jgi:sugar phosphate permease
LPSLGGAYADYIVETPHYEKEIEALEDFFTNIGYVVGPIIAGILADKFGNINVFSIIGFGSMMIILFLLKVTPKSIRI